MNINDIVIENQKTKLVYSGRLSAVRKKERRLHNTQTAEVKIEDELTQGVE